MSGVILQGNQAGQWGVCSFVGVLNALYEQGELETRGRTLTIEEIQQRLGSELIGYLKFVTVSDPTLAARILKYTQSFRSVYETYKSLDDICTRIELQVRNSDWANMQDGIGIGMPADAVQSYCEHLGLKSTLKTLTDPPFTCSELVKQTRCIVGCGRGPKTDLEHGLRHWVYVNKDGIMKNWGVETNLKTQPLPQSVLDKNYSYIPCVIQLQ